MARPAQLDDPEWLRRAYGAKGDRLIAQELGTTRDVVRGARRQHGIDPEPGRRRGFIPQPVSTVPAVAALDRVVARYRAERSLDDGPSPSVVLIETRNRALRHALLTRDDVLICEALEAAAAGMILVLDHRQAAAHAA